MHRNPVPILNGATLQAVRISAGIERKGTKGKKNCTGRQGAVWSSRALCKCRYSSQFFGEYFYSSIVLFQR